MDERNKKCCPNCSQFYFLKSLSPKAHGNVPLFLKCGHSMCEHCIRNIIKVGEPIQCKICIKDMEISAADLALLLQNKLDLYHFFPVNIYMLGELAYEHIEPTSEKTTKNKTDYFTEMKHIIEGPENVQAECMECHNPTTKICKQCETTLCNNCFNKIHKNFVIFKNHTLQNIDSLITTSKCKMHNDKPLDYYCKDCNKAICMDCLMVGGEKSCKNHDVVSMQEVNESLLQELSDITPKVDEIYRRLTKTAVDIGHLMCNIENNTVISETAQMIHDINQHFSKLMLNIQKHKNNVMNVILKLQSLEKESLDVAKNKVTKAIREAKSSLSAIKSIDDKNLKQANISSILEEAKKIIDIPWYLNEDVTNNDLKVTVNEDLGTLLSDYINLEGSSSAKYKLLATQELEEQKIEIPPPPLAVVHPPEFPKDVRQIKKMRPDKEEPKPALYTQVPKYRSKSGSCSSLNSITSDNSNRSGTFENQIVQQVSPFPESLQPKKLYEGSQELIYISHIVDVHNFFVQRACQQSQVQDMLRELRNAVALPKPPINHVAEGKFYLAFNKADNMWQRCRVVSIERKDTNNPRFHVFCIDFGSTEVVTIDKLRYLPPARVHAPPPFAINCSLANCQPKNGVWTNEDAILMQKIINNKQAIIHIRSIRSKSNYTVTFDCDVTTYEDGVSLAHALVFHERAKMPNPRLPYPKFMSSLEKPKIYASHNDFMPNAVEEVYITYITSPDHFCVRKQHVQSVFEKLCEDLDQEYSLSVHNGSIYLPEIGMVCAVNVEKHMSRNADTQLASAGGWARGVVREAPGRGRVRVWLPDAGAVLLVHWTALRRLMPHFATLRALAVECHLAGVTPLNKKWSPGSVALLKHFENRLLDLHVEDNRNRGSLGVTLYDKSDPDNVICINQQMIKHKFAVTFGIFMFNKDNDINEQVITHKTPLDQPPQKKQPKSDNVKILKKKQVQKTQITEGDLEAKDKGPLRLEIKILHYQSPALFYVSLIHQQKTFDELSDKMQKYYSKRQDTLQGKTTWQIGDRCCTICIQSQTWRRAAILEIDGDKAKVFYSDFACVETVPILSLKELTKDFASIGDAAFKCHLCGVIPAVGEDWPSLTKEYLKELIDAYKRIFITKHGNFKDKSMPVELWVYHTVQGGALEPNLSEWRCLNQKIIQQGLGIPDKSHELSDTQNEENTDDNMLSFLNVTGSVNEWLQLEPTEIPIKSLNKTKHVNSDNESSSHSSTPVNYELETKVERDDKNTTFISDWQPPEPLPSEEFIGMPTYVDHDGVIYMHTIDQQDTLDLIRKALDVRFKNPDPKAKYSKWTVGEPCIALYYLDNRFYRGRVLEVNEEESKCLIHYIDYGNEETCSFVNMRKSIALYQIPTQAHKCILDRIRPTSNVWDRQTLDYIHKSIVEKKCFVKVSGSAVEGVTPIELKFSKLWINDHLVEFEMATYTDGSIAVTRKFASPKTKKQRAKESFIVESDSGPDYILEDDSLNMKQLHDSYNIENMKGKDWNELIEEEDIGNDLITYPQQVTDAFSCHITIINDTSTLELAVLHSEDVAKLYEEMFEKLQTDAKDMNPLNGIFENKSCIAVFPEDDQWYRASILQFSVEKNRIKVKFIDYGNIEVISPADVKEITEEYAKLPPATVSANLYGIKLNADIELSVITEAYQDTFLDTAPFRCKIVEYKNSIPQVELRNDDGELVYDNLIKENIFLIV